MGCASSKQMDAAVDVYRPAPTSFAVFDINAVKEPWLTVEDQDQKLPEKVSHVPSKVLEKLDKLEDAPRTWDEVSKELENLKPTLNSPAPPPPDPSPVVEPPSAAVDAHPPLKKVKRKSFSFHTLEELDNKVDVTFNKPTGLKKTESMNGLTQTKKNGTKNEFTQLRKIESRVGFAPPPPVTEGYKSLKENPFLLRDKLEREKEGKPPLSFTWDPLRDYQEKCPPGGENKVVIYTTSLGGVRRTKEDCNTVRSIIDLHGFLFEERDVSLHGEFLTELNELLRSEEEGAAASRSVPRMFVKGRYIGGVDEVLSLNETGRLRRLLSRAGIEKEVGRHVCEGCGGARFVPCFDCGGSCKVVVVGKKEKERCPECNENGLVYCPICS